MCYGARGTALLVIGCRLPADQRFVKTATKNKIKEGNRGDTALMPKGNAPGTWLSVRVETSVRWVTLAAGRALPAAASGGRGGSRPRHTWAGPAALRGGGLLGHASAACRVGLEARARPSLRHTAALPQAGPGRNPGSFRRQNSPASVSLSITRK